MKKSYGRIRRNSKEGFEELEEKERRLKEKGKYIDKREK